MEELAWTESQKSDPGQYKRGLLAEINSPVKGFRVGEKVEVVGTRDDMVRVRGVGPCATKSRPLPLDNPEAFSVYEQAVKNGCQWEVLRNLPWTDARKSDPDQYRPGLVAKINGHVQGFSLGEQLEVIGKSGDMVRVRSDDGYHTKIKALPIGAPKTFSINERDTIEICEGEQLRATANGYSEDGHRLNTGSDYAVDYISHDGKIVLENGWRLSRSWKHLEYGYTDTSYGAQSKTVDRLFIAQSPELSAKASDLTQFLVTISRGSKEPKLYTTDLELLREDVSQVRERLMATELLYGHSEERAPEKALCRTSTKLGMQAAEKEPEVPVSLSLGRSGPKISKNKAKVLRKLPAVAHELEIKPPPPERKRKREQEQEMAMGMGM